MASENDNRMNQKTTTWWQLALQPACHFRRQAIGLLVLFSILFALYAPYGKNFLSQGLWNTVDPVAGISAFILSFIILYNQAYTRWEESLEKQLTVHFRKMENNQEIAVIERAYLSGESDIRPWAQQLGSQIFGKMKFDMNWDETPPRIISDLHNGKTAFTKVYEITIYFHQEDSLTENIKTFVDRGGTFKHSSIEGDADNLPVRWIRKT